MWSSAATTAAVLSQQNRIADSEFIGQTVGGAISDSHLNTIVRTSFGGEDGLNVYHSHFNRFVDSSASGASFNGALVTGSYNSFIRTNVSGAGSGDGFTLRLDGSHNVVQDATLDGGGTSVPVLDLIGGSGNTIRRNQISADASPLTAVDGIFVPAGATDTLVVDNTADKMSDDGIDVESPSTTLRYNRADDNGDYGIEAVPGVKGKGNTATGNGNPAQCLNIVCN
jgi:hypothetical protein